MLPFTVSNAFDKSRNMEQEYNPLSALLKRLEYILSTAYEVADVGLKPN